MADDEQVAVKTYVPRYQKEVWKEHADELGMSQSEFVRTMVQAGRSDFDIPTLESDRQPVQQPDGGVDTDGFESGVIAALEREGVLDWAELVDALVDDVEDELEEAVHRLEEDGAIRYRPRDGGYVLLDHE